MMGAGAPGAEMAARQRELADSSTGFGGIHSTIGSVEEAHRRTHAIG